jgi:hypothetical protein
MRDLSFWTNVALALIALHFVVGFGFLMYKLRPTKKSKSEDEEV